MVIGYSPVSQPRPMTYEVHIDCVSLRNGVIVGEKVGEGTTYYIPLETILTIRGRGVQVLGMGGWIRTSPEVALQITRWVEGYIDERQTASI